MSAFALSGLAVAMKKLNGAISDIETYCDSDDAANEARLVGDAFAKLLVCRGEITKVLQGLELAEVISERGSLIRYEMKKAPTESAPPLLRLVKP